VISRVLPEQRANLLAALGAWRNVRAQSRMGQRRRDAGMHIELRCTGRTPERL